MNKLFHPYHLVTIRPWPLLTSLRIFNILIWSIHWINLSKFFYNPLLSFILSILSLILCRLLWWRDIIRESTFQGSHSSEVYKGLRLGIILFIISEILFFLSFFWAYFHSALSPSIEIGQLWPPKGIYPFNPYDIPLLNTIILISSGLSVTWSHHAIISKSLKDSSLSLLITIILGLIFSLIQFIEYKVSSFTVSDSIYGSTFFITTGFHGIHVLIGSCFLSVCLFRIIYLQFSRTHHFGFEAASWY